MFLLHEISAVYVPLPHRSGAHYILISDKVLTSVWVSVSVLRCVGVCHPDEGTEHMSGAAAGERGGNI